MKSSSKPAGRISAFNRRKRLFDIYSVNLQAVKQHPNVRLDPDVDDVFVCPLCFRYFTREEVLDQERKNNSVTIEHVPPEALGGKERTLTCVDCNRTAGHQLDSHLIHSLELTDFVAGIPGSSVDAKFTINEKITLNGTVRFAEDRQLEIFYDHRRSSKKQVDEFEKLESPGPQTLNMTFRGRRGRFHKQRRAECSLLRIAYLWAFSLFGYGFIINHALSHVRTQIKNPTEDILPSWGIAQRDDYPDYSLGVNIITQPKELQAFLVVFDVKTALRKIRYGVLLPGPTMPGINIYQYLHDTSNVNHTTPITFKPIPNERRFIENTEYCFASHEIWKNWRAVS